MKLTQHAFFYFLSVLALSLINLKWRFILSNVFFLQCIPYFFLNPDLDFLFEKWGWHRSAWFHSILLPLSFYYATRPYINFASNMGEFSILIFLSTIVHLLCDSKPDAVIRAIIDDAKEYHQKKDALEEKQKQGKARKTTKIKISEGTQEVGGTWQLSLRPFSSKRMGFYGTLIWMIVNIGAMIIMIIMNFF